MSSNSNNPQLGQYSGLQQQAETSNAITSSFTTQGVAAASSSLPLYTPYNGIQTTTTSSSSSYTTSAPIQYDATTSGITYSTVPPTQNIYSSYSNIATTGQSSYATNSLATSSQLSAGSSLSNQYGLQTTPAVNLATSFQPTSSFSAQTNVSSSYDQKYIDEILAKSRLQTASYGSTSPTKGIAGTALTISQNAESSQAAYTYSNLYSSSQANPIYTNNLTTSTYDKSSPLKQTSAFGTTTSPAVNYRVEIKAQLKYLNNMKEELTLKQTEYQREVSSLMKSMKQDMEVEFDKTLDQVGGQQTQDSVSGLSDRAIQLQSEIDKLSEKLSLADKLNQKFAVQVENLQKALDSTSKEKIDVQSSSSDEELVSKLKLELNELRQQYESLKSEYTNELNKSSSNSSESDKQQYELQVKEIITLKSQLHIVSDEKQSLQSQLNTQILLVEQFKKESESLLLQNNTLQATIEKLHKDNISIQDNNQTQLSYTKIQTEISEKDEELKRLQSFVQEVQQAGQLKVLEREQLIIQKDQIIQSQKEELQLLSQRLELVISDRRVTHETYSITESVRFDNKSERKEVQVQNAQNEIVFDDEEKEEQAEEEEFDLNLEQSTYKERKEEDKQGFFDNAGSLTKDLMDNKQVQDAMKNEKDGMSKKVNELNVKYLDSERQNNEKIALFQKQEKELKEQIKKLQEQLDQLTKQKAEKEASLQKEFEAKLVQEQNKLNQDISHLKQQLNDQAKDHESEILKFKQAQQNNNSELLASQELKNSQFQSTFSEQRVALEAKITQLTQETKTLQERLHEENTKSTSEISHLKQQLNEETQKHESQVVKLNQTHQSSNSELAIKQEQKLNELQNNFSEQKLALEAKVAQLNQEVTTLQLKLDEEKTQSDIRISQILNSQTSSSSQLISQNELRITELQNNFNDQRSSLEARIAELTQQLALFEQKLRDERFNYEALETQTSQKNSSAEQTIDSLKSQITSLEQKITSLEQKITELNHNHTSSVNALNEQHLIKINELEDHQKKSIAILEENHAKYIATIQENHKNVIASAEEASKKQLNASEQQKFESIEAQYKQKIANIEKEHQLKIDETILSFKLKIQEAENSSISKLETLNHEKTDIISQNTNIVKENQEKEQKLQKEISELKLRIETVSNQHQKELIKQEERYQSLRLTLSSSVDKSSTQANASTSSNPEYLILQQDHKDLLEINKENLKKIQEERRLYGILKEECNKLEQQISTLKNQQKSNGEKKQKNNSAITTTTTTIETSGTGTEVQASTTTTPNVSTTQVKKNKSYQEVEERRSKELEINLLQLKEQNAVIRAQVREDYESQILSLERQAQEYEQKMNELERVKIELKVLKEEKEEAEWNSARKNNAKSATTEGQAKKSGLEKEKEELQKVIEKKNEEMRKMKKTLNLSQTSFNKLEKQYKLLTGQAGDQTPATATKVETVNTLNTEENENTKKTNKKGSNKVDDDLTKILQLSEIIYLINKQ